jgi:hypothetical protein
MNYQGSKYSFLPDVEQPKAAAVVFHEGVVFTHQAILPVVKKQPL